MVADLVLGGDKAIGPGEFGDRGAQNSNPAIAWRFRLDRELTERLGRLHSLDGRMALSSSGPGVC